MQVRVEDQFPDLAVPTLTYQLESVHSWADLVESALQLASMVIPCDLLVWNRIDYANGGVFARGTQLSSYYEDPDAARDLLSLEDPTNNEPEDGQYSADTWSVFGCR